MDKDIIRTWTHKTVTLDLWYDHWLGRRDYLRYCLKDKDTIIFENTDFSPSPSCVHDADDTVYALLNFLTLQPGDTDDDYFAHHTPEQLEWIESDIAEEIRSLMYDFEYAKEEG